MSSVRPCSRCLVQIFAGGTRRWPFGGPPVQSWPMAGPEPTATTLEGIMLSVAWTALRTGLRSFDTTEAL